MKKTLFLLAAVFLILTFSINLSNAASNNKNMVTLPTMSFEVKAQSMKAETTGGSSNYIDQKEFDELMKKSQLLINNNRANDAYNLINAYEVYTFGSYSHFENLAKFDWQMVQIYERRLKYTDMIRYLNYIIDRSEQPKPTKYAHQYVHIYDAVPEKYYYAAATNPPVEVFNAATAKMNELKKASEKLNTKIDPRMKYEDYPRRRKNSGL